MFERLLLILFIDRNKNTNLETMTTAFFLIWHINFSKLQVVAKREAIHEHYYAFMPEHINYGGQHLILIIRYELFNKSHVPHLFVKLNRSSKFSATILFVYCFTKLSNNP